MPRSQVSDDRCPRSQHGALEPTERAAIAETDLTLVRGRLGGGGAQLFVHADLPRYAASASRMTSRASLREYGRSTSEVLPSRTL